MHITRLSTHKHSDSPETDQAATCPQHIKNMLWTDEINFVTLRPPSESDQKRVLIFFVPGNPGLIEYYRHFLDILRTQLNDQVSTTSTQYYISGASLAGFDINSRSRQVPATNQGLPVSLDAQVADVFGRLESTVARIRRVDHIEGDLPVVVIGHSIGAYMVLETVAEWQRQEQQRPTGMKILAGLCLFPTIYELNLSPTGRKVGVRTTQFVHMLHSSTKL